MVFDGKPLAGKLLCTKEEDIQEELAVLRSARGKKGLVQYVGYTVYNEKTIVLLQPAQASLRDVFQFQHARFMLFEDTVVYAAMLGIARGLHELELMDLCHSNVTPGK
jgi:hypothetical protein